METAKAWVALLALIVTSLLASDVIPVTGVFHTVLVIASVILGAFATWMTPNKTRTELSS